MFKELRIEVNKACNLACDHCYTEKKGPRSIDLPKLEAIVAEAATRGAESLSLTGGEPLIEIDRTLALIRAGKDKGLIVRLNTNGILITREVAQDLKDAGVDEVQISLNSSEADDFDLFVHRRGAFKKVEAAIGFLNELGIETTIRYTLMIRNLYHLVPTYKVISRWGVTNFKVRNLVQVNDIHEGGWDEAGTNIKTELLKLIEISKDAQINVFIADDGLGSISSKVGKCDKLVCKCGADAMFISSEGNIAPCPFLREDSEYHLGNIANDDLFVVYDTSPGLKLFIGNKQKGIKGGNEQVDHCKASVLASAKINA